MILNQPIPTSALLIRPGTRSEFQFDAPADDTTFRFEYQSNKPLIAAVMTAANYERYKGGEKNVDTVGTAGPTSWGVWEGKVGSGRHYLLIVNQGQKPAKAFVRVYGFVIPIRTALRGVRIQGARF